MITIIKIFTGIPGWDGRKGLRGDDCGYCAPG